MRAPGVNAAIARYYFHPWRMIRDMEQWADIRRRVLVEGTMRYLIVNLLFMERNTKKDIKFHFMNFPRILVGFGSRPTLTLAIVSLAASDNFGLSEL